MIIHSLHETNENIGLHIKFSSMAGKNVKIKVLISDTT